MNQKYIIDNFCVNTDKPEMNCDGQCFLSTKLKEEQERQENSTALIFNQDFGIYIPTSATSFPNPPKIFEALAHLSFYKTWFGKTITKEIDRPPQA